MLENDGVFVWWYSNNKSFQVGTQALMLLPLQGREVTMKGMWVKSTQNTHNFSLFQPNTAHSVCVNGMTAFPHFTHTNNLHVGCAEGRIYYL